MSDTILFVGNENQLIEQLAKQAQAQGYHLYALRNPERDILSEEDAIQAVQRIQAETGPIAFFIWGALYRSGVAFGELTNNEYQAYMHKAVHQAFYFSKACIKSMEKRRFGRILFLTSIAVVLGDEDFLFTLSSGSLNTLAKSIAREEARKGISANALALGCIDDWETTNTPLIQLFYKHYYPFRNHFTFEQLACVILNLVTDKTAAINGQIVKLDGGTL